MQKNEFVQVIKIMQDQDQKLNSLYALGVDLINVVEGHNQIINKLIECQFGNLGADLIYWFLFDSSPKVIHVGKKKIKVDTAEKLFDYLVKEGYLK